MRKFTTALLLATASLASLSTTAFAQRNNDVTTDIDVIRSQRDDREQAQQRSEQVREQRSEPQRQEQARQEQPRQVFEQRQPRDSGNAQQQGNVEVRRDDRGFRGRPEQQNGTEVRRDNRGFGRLFNQQNNVEVRRDRGDSDRNFENRRRDRNQGNVFSGTQPQVDVQNDQRRDGRRFDGRRFEQNDGQRFGRNEEYRSNRDDGRRFNRDGDRRRDEVARDGNWFRDGNGSWQRRDNRNYGNRDGRNYDNGYGRKDYGRNDYRWNKDWRSDRRYDWQSYRFSNRDFFRQSRYYDPFGSRYGYQRFSIGIRIGSGYYSDRYWISDPYAYRLPYVDGSYRWVRYYNDVLLIDLRTGYVVDMIYDFFW